jgi:hypothetical protein
MNRRECNEEGCIFKVWARGKCKKHDFLAANSKKCVRAVVRTNKAKSIKKSPRKKKAKVSPKKRKTIAALKKLARYWFQRWVRYIKVGGGCDCYYGCGKWLAFKGSNAGHYLKAEVYPAAIFDPDNVFPVCPGCNIMDPTIEYRKHLVKLKGVDFVTKLENKYKRNKGVYKWDRTFLEEIIVEYKAKCKDIETYW